MLSPPRCSRPAYNKGTGRPDPASPLLRFLRLKRREQVNEALRHRFGDDAGQEVPKHASDLRLDRLVKHSAGTGVAWRWCLHIPNRPRSVRTGPGHTSVLSKHSC